MWGRRRHGLGDRYLLVDHSPGPGGAWQFRWEALRIGSAHKINDLPGLDALGLSFETADRHAPAKDVVADYYRRYEDHYGLQVVRPADVVSVENFGTPPGTPATAGVDYIFPTPDPVVTIPAGQSSATFDVTIVRDTLVEGDEQFVLSAYGELLTETGGEGHVLLGAA